MEIVALVLLLLSAPGAASLHIVFGAHTIPHPAKASTFGEDAFFFDDSLGTFGIADGVGGSAKGSVDPGAFSREVLQRCHMSSSFLSTSNAAGGIDAALQMASEAPIALGGSTTVVLGQLEAGTERLRLLNLGDSGAMVLRPSLREFGRGFKVLFPRCVLRSQYQEHGFNWPFQVSAKNLGSITHDFDKVATDVREGDVLIACTDGVLDNLFDVDLQASTSEQLDALMGDDPNAAQEAITYLAKSIAEQAHGVALARNDPTIKTPWMVAAAEEGYEKQGGKLDDIAIVCGVVRRGERPQLRMVHNFNGAPEGQVKPQPEAWTSGTVLPTSVVPRAPAAAAEPISEYERYMASRKDAPMHVLRGAPTPEPEPMSEYERYMARRNQLQ